MIARALLAAVATLALAAPLAAQDFAITGATLATGDGSDPVENATVVVRGGRVVAAGVGVAVPAGVPVSDGTGTWVTPGAHPAARCAVRGGVGGGVPDPVRRAGRGRAGAGAQRGRGRALLQRRTGRHLAPLRRAADAGAGWILAGRSPSGEDPASAFERDDLAGLIERVERGPEDWHYDSEREWEARYGADEEE
ncbi:hypothetical protein J4558_02525 [Leptolyngbya sp. 15MV]|nr:hypothetical protein J4558_02525 [Leptolyngbya sp. 15MV]